MKRWPPALSLLAAALRLDAQSPALGPEFQVNQITTQDQGAARVASDANGNFVAVWSGFGIGMNTGEVLARRFDSSGAPLGNEFVVGAFTGACCADIAMTPTGDFVVAWRDYSDGNGSGVVARRYDSGGNPTSGPVAVNTYTTSNQIFQRVDIDPAGDFVVVWTSWPEQDGSGYGIFAQRFNSAAVKQGGEFQVNTYTTGKQAYPDVSLAPSGDFVVVWFGDHGPSSYDVVGQRFNNLGIPQGGEFTVNQYTGPGFRIVPSTDSDASGNFVVTWMSIGQTGPYYDVFARRFASDGTPGGDEFAVNPAAATTVNQTGPEVAVAEDGHFTIAWNAFEAAPAHHILARRYDASAKPETSVLQVNTNTTLNQSGASVSVDGRGGFAIVWNCSDKGPCFDGDSGSVVGRLGGVPAARPMRVDAPGGNATEGTSNQNGVLEPDEAAVVVTAWNNNTGEDLALTGSGSHFTGPPGPTYFLLDTAADYGTISDGATNDCATGPAAEDCYSLTLSGTRPSLHWDATFEETLSSNETKTWTLHVGESFADVPVAHTFYAFIENVLHNGITGGCGAGNYCPGDSVTRAQMAVFLLKSKHGADYLPPPCSGSFPDVDCPGLFTDWIEQLANEGITSGCGGGDYCPNNAVTRAQMAVFLLKSLEGSSYDPPDCTDVFGDVPCTPGTGFSDWIEDLYSRQITGGCQASPLLYCPGNPNNRGQMAVFLVKTFSLELYGP